MCGADKALSSDFLRGAGDPNFYVKSPIFEMSEINSKFLKRCVGPNQIYFCAAIRSQATHLQPLHYLLLSPGWLKEVKVVEGIPSWG